jgi:hypothetical protein
MCAGVQQLNSDKVAGHSVHTVLQSGQQCYSKGTVSLHRGVNLATYFHLVSRLKAHGANINSLIQRNGVQQVPHEHSNHLRNYKVQ